MTETTTPTPGTPLVEGLDADFRVLIAGVEVIWYRRNNRLWRNKVGTGYVTPTERSFCKEHAEVPMLVKPEPKQPPRPSDKTRAERLEAFKRDLGALDKNAGPYAALDVLRLANEHFGESEGDDAI